MDKNFNRDEEEKIYQKWEESGAFQPSDAEESFTIAIPPPNVTGTLHLGHAIMLAIEDIMIRYNRMKGKSALWVPGTDHAAIATENVVLKNLGAKSREEYSRKDFMQHCRDWTQKSHATITNQIRRMGSSCDWTREAYTFDEKRHHAVNTIFKMLYDDGLIVRGKRMVNWSVGAQSVLADDELEWKEQIDPLYYIKYGPFVVATVRPETIFGDTGVAVNPDDKRYKEWINKDVEIGTVLGKMTLKVIADKHVDVEFGTGVVKITPAHDPNDFEVGKRHDLEVRQVIDQDGKMNQHAGKFAGLDRFKARKQIVEEMKKKDLIEKIEEDYVHRVAYCYRSHTIVEPMVSQQWFISVEKEFTDKWTGETTTLKKLTADGVRENHVELIPKRFDKIYFNWIDNLRDWCISRQIWWGHRIPVWYCDDCSGEIVCAEDDCKCPHCGSENIHQDEDTLDTWFSSALWPFSTLDWPNENAEDFKKFYPTSVLETGHDILFFWVARMIMFGRYATGKYPFHTCYLHGLVCDAQGKKMSKSKGNGIDPLDMIAKFGTDAVRLSLIMGTTPGNNVGLGEEKIAGCRNYCNKLWNISRFVLSKKDGGGINSAEPTTDLQKWIVSERNKLIKKVSSDIEEYRFGAGAESLWQFTWDNFADWAVESAKAENNPQTNQILLDTLRILVALHHPFIPFITEKLWEELGEKEMLISSAFPVCSDEKYENNFEVIKNIISRIRSIRAEQKVEPAKKITAFFNGEKTNIIQENEDIVRFLARLDKIEYDTEEENAITTLEEGIEIILPMSGMIDEEKEAERREKEVSEYQKKLKGLEIRLANKGYVASAPEHLVEETRQQAEELKEKLKLLGA